MLHEQLFGAFVRSFCTGLAIPCDRPTTAPILEAGLAAFSPPPSHPTLFLMLRCPHCPSLPRLEQPVRAQNRRFHGLEKCPGPSSTASARERHQPPTLARRQPASRAAPLGALGRRSAMRSPAGAGRGGCRSLRSILTGAWSAAAAMVGAEPSSSAAAAAAAAAVGPLAAASLARRRRRAVGARVQRRPSSGPRLGVRRPALLQQGPAHARRP